MPLRSVAIVGSGIAGATMAYTLVNQGIEVRIFEKGGDYPYPHLQPFAEEYLYQAKGTTNYKLPPDLRAITTSGNYGSDVNEERLLVRGGAATAWGAMTDRMHPDDFHTHRRFGYGADWPISYDELEPFYCDAEHLIGVSGSSKERFAPPRSRAYPLPAFPLTYDARGLIDKLARREMLFHPSPQARASRPYDGRPACANFGACGVCPIGARYSPGHHLALAMQSGRCHIETNSSVRSIVLDRSGRARALVVRRNDEPHDREWAADAIIIAGGAIETARLLLLTGGLPAASGQVGRHLVFHHIFVGALEYAPLMHAGRIGPEAAQSRQFLSPQGRGRHGGVLLQIPSTPADWAHGVSVEGATSGADVLRAARSRPHTEMIFVHAESLGSDGKQVRLSDRRDRFGDPFAHVHYERNDFDEATHRFGRALFDRMGDVTGATFRTLGDSASYISGHHHMGTCRMSRHPADGVVDPFGRVHGVANLFLAGSSTFAGTSGAVHPTLTIVALALRTVRHLVATAS